MVSVGSFSKIEDNIIRCSAKMHLMFSLGNVAKDCLMFFISKKGTIGCAQ